LRKWVGRIGVLLLLMALMGAAAHGAELEIGIASAFESEHVLVKSAVKFKEIVEERSGGKIKVNLFPGGVMGGEEQVTEAVSIGAVEMQVGGGLPIYYFAPEYYFFDTPYVLRDFKHYMAVWDGPIGQAARQQIEANGNTRMLGVVYRGMRQFTSNKPVKAPEDVKGMKLRLPMLETWVAVWKAIGASPVPIPLHELYTALATGVADASEGDMEQLWSHKLFEVQKYVSLTNHHVQTGNMSICADFYYSLDKDTQKLIDEAAREATEWGTNLVYEREQLLIENMKEKGCTILETDSEAFRKAGAPAVESMFTTHFPVTTWDEINKF